MCPIKASVSGHWNRSEFVRCGTHGADIIVVGKPEYADRFEDWAYEEEGLKFYRRNFQPDELRMFGKRPRPINSNSNNSTSNKRDLCQRDGAQQNLLWRFLLLKSSVTLYKLCVCTR
ncbi:uncharacterized protein LOC119770437 isoform X1 [Culex quinquefasciatus]|uniref:uncharacterized protein LOC119770437 isoform X1 n=1 Tax=Culex quinquefasciatus TaxID=7176 RepID=UPI0018E3DFC0|nr:uncharacterized protein LOC119770437 isoform X1 [Culex quinquefasciatus]